MIRNSLVAWAVVAFLFNLTARAQIVADGGFELGSPSPVWDESSTNFGSPICNTMQCGTFFGKPFEGDWWAWFGGSPVLESGMLSQEVTIATGTATLIFQLDITQANGKPMNEPPHPVLAIGKVRHVGDRVAGLEVDLPGCVDIHHFPPLAPPSGRGRAGSSRPDRDPGAH